MQKAKTFTAEDVKIHAMTMLRCNLRPVSTARALGIDPSTLNRRIRQIREQTGLNLRVYYQCLQAAKGGVRLG